MPSASNNNQSNTTKLVKQSSVNSMNSGGQSGTSAVSGGAGGKGNNKKLTETTSKSNKNSTAPTTTAVNASNAAAANNGNGNLETSSIKDHTNNGVAVAAAASASSSSAISSGQNGKNWETNSAAGNSNAPSTTQKDAGNDALNPMKLTFTTIEHKIRNLEKRKTKLEGYRAIAALGKELSSDQKAAVDKYDAVIATLEFARDLVKQMQQFTKDAEKEQKKQARKDLIAKAQAETVKIRDVLIIQNILSCFTDEQVRNDFLHGEHGAAKLELSEMDIIEKFCIDVQTRRPETSDDAPFATTAYKAAEIFSMTIDARPKAYRETTYENVRRIFHRIQESDYLDKIYLIDVPEPEEFKEDAEIVDVETQNDDMEEGDVGLQSEQQQMNDQEDAVTTGMEGLEEGMEKLNIENAASSGVLLNEMNENIMIVKQQLHQPPQQQPQINEQHMEMREQQQQQAQQVSVPNMGNVGQPLMPTPMAPPASAVPAFQPTAPAPGHSGATTPVHVAMYSIPNMQPQLTPQQLQQLPPAQGLMGAGVQPSAGPVQHAANIAPQQQQQPSNAGGVPSQRQMLGSPANPGAAVAAMAPMQQAPPPPGLYNPTPVHAVEQTYFKQHSNHPQQQHQQQQQQQHQQYLQQMRPLAEVIGGGNFYFLQDSELDSPELNAQGQAGPHTTLIFEQQQQPQQQQQQVMPPQQPTTQLTPQQQQPPQMPPQQPTQQLLQNLQKNSPNEQQQVMSNGIVPAATAPQGSLPAHQQQQQQHLQQALNQTAPIQSQTFTNQSFPHMASTQQQQQASNVMTSSTPSPLFHQQHQQQQQQLQQHQQQAPQTQKPPQQPQKLFSPVQGQNMQNAQQQTPSQMLMSGSVDIQQPALMLLNRLAAGNPQNPLMQQQHQHLQQHPQHQLQQQMQQTQQQPQTLPPQAMLQQQQQQVNSTPQSLIAGMHQMPTNPPPAGELSQTNKTVVFPFDNPVMAGITSYEHQLQNQQMQNQLNNAANVLKKSLGVRGAGEDDSKPPVIQKSDLINDWSQDGAVINTPTVGSSNANPNEFNTITTNVETNKWTTASSTPDVNANSPLTVQTQTPQQTQRKNEWTSSATTGSSGGSSGATVENYGHDNRSAEPANHWHSQESQGGYGRNSANRQTPQQVGGGMTGAQTNSGGYQRRNEDRRGGDDRRPGGNSGGQGGGGGGGGGGGYRGRSNYNAGGPQQNGNSGRGGNTSGIFFRNNDNSSGSYYQNGGSGGTGGGAAGNVYANKDGGSRYESGGPRQYRGPRTAVNNGENARSSGPPPRHMGGGGGSGGGRSGGQPSNNTNSNSYMNSRQSTNRMPMGLENKN